MVTIEDKEQFTNEVEESDDLVLADFWAEWCGPCKMLNPIIEELDGNYEDLKIAKVNVEDNIEIAQDYQIRAVPAIFLFKNGEIVDKKIGVVKVDDLEDMIEDYVDEDSAKDEEE